MALSGWDNGLKQSKPVPKSRLLSGERCAADAVQFTSGRPGWYIGILLSSGTIVRSSVLPRLWPDLAAR